MCLPAAPAEGNRGGQGRRYASAECAHLGRSPDGCGCPSGGRAGLVRMASADGAAGDVRRGDAGDLGSHLGAASDRDPARARGASGCLGSSAASVAKLGTSRIAPAGAAGHAAVRFSCLGGARFPCASRVFGLAGSLGRSEPDPRPGVGSPCSAIPRTSRVARLGDTRRANSHAFDRSGLGGACGAGRSPGVDLGSARG